MSPQLIDRIYECSLLPELWPGVLGELAVIAGARCGVMFAASPTTGIFSSLASPGVERDLSTYVTGGWLARDGRQHRLTSANYPGWLTTGDLFNETELETDEAIQGFFRPIGLGWAALTGIPLPTDDWIILTVERDYDRGPVDRAAVSALDSTRPHLARSALLSLRIQMERARAATQTLALIGLPALVFDQWGKVLGANSLFEALTDHVRWRARDRISLKDRSADAMLRAVMETLEHEDVLGVGSFAIRDADGNAAMVAHVIPVRLAARDIFTRCAGVLVLTPVTMPNAPPVELVRSLFDLTPAEARVARGLASGGTVEEIASQSSVSPNTVRVQVRGVLEKTGCRRQTDVVALLSGLSLPPAI